MQIGAMLVNFSQFQFRINFGAGMHGCKSGFDLDINNKEPNV
jgi:hypothetical protein